MLYRQSIAIFGFALPLAGCGALLIGGFLLKSSVQRSFDRKQALYKSHEKDRLQALDLEAQISRKRPHIDRWNDQLARETANTVSSHIRDITKILPGKEFQLTGNDRPGGSGGIGGISAQTSTQTKLSFRGTFRSMQQALLELETRMPQLQLQDFQIDPSSNSDSNLNFQVTYTAWEKEKEKDK